MNYYVVNENVTPQEIFHINASIVPFGHLAYSWPTNDAQLPSNLDAALIVIQATSSVLEEQRVISVIGAGKRVVCLYLAPVPQVSPLVQNFCSAEVGIGDEELGAALDGSAEVHKDYHSNPTKKNPQKPHRC